MNSGFAKHIEKEKVIEVFHTVAWPALFSAGWTKQLFNDELIFVPKDIDPGTGVKGVDYYSRIKDVVDRLNERRNDLESSVADLLRRGVNKLSKKPVLSPRLPARRLRSKEGVKSETSSVADDDGIDLSWKRGGRHYPTKSSSVGAEFQVNSLPKAGVYTEEECPARSDLVWSAAAALEKGLDVDTLMKPIPYNVREEAYILLMEKNFNVDAFTDAAKNLTPIDGSDWDQKTRKQFADLIFKKRKNMSAVASEMGIPMKTALAYYLGSFKASEGYRLLKTVCCEERMERFNNAENSVDACCVCGDGGSLLICDGCNKEYHATCLRPKLAKIPEGDWECDECVSRKFLQTRDYVLENCGLFEKSESRKRSHAEAEGKEVSEQPVTRVRPDVVDAICAFAKACSEALSRVNPTNDGEEKVEFDGKEECMMVEAGVQ
ncbi:bromodomain adjacent to zinc finger domain protein 1A [Fistulifera solaris]|uniref:Bromodomain adjacent to zinc finger domain protein 1A n=1 Tax=Fistulifera solaris TaxID=1519565 RepID=A0A1Z5KRL4_FISSO|nr:bromodomain adjacent to zinc finger domain protein 1A [Fistulifera solaris]|eukprot:GAX28558.1 bromodomain adjacent to zinc finger domain protein 1A [Fistulifera solaris]